MKTDCKEETKTKRRKTVDTLCSASGLLLSVACCIALIHVELKIQEHHRLISHSVTFCDQMETEILRKVQQNYGKCKEEKGSHSEGHETRGEFVFTSGILIYRARHTVRNYSFCILTSLTLFNDIIYKSAFNRKNKSRK